MRRGLVALGGAIGAVFAGIFYWSLNYTYIDWVYVDWIGWIRKARHIDPAISAILAIISIVGFIVMVYGFLASPNDGNRGV